MIFKKKYLLLAIFLIITIQILLFTNNKQRTTFRLFKWTLREVSIGKLISISFLSGICISTLLTNVSYGNNNFKKIEDDYEPLNNDEYIRSEEDTNVEIPPQRDIRDAQPTISVNYRVIKNTEDNNLERDQNYSKNLNNKDDWDNNEDNDW